MTTWASARVVDDPFEQDRQERRLEPIKGCEITGGYCRALSGRSRLRQGERGPWLRRERSNGPRVSENWWRTDA